MMTLDPNKIRNRLRSEYSHVETYTYGDEQPPIFFACNYDDDTFMIVSIYMDAEIGGHFTLDASFQMEYVHRHFDAQQAWDLCEGIIKSVDAGEVVVLGDIKPNELN